MKAYNASQPWMPPISKVPVRVQKSLLPFTPAIKGWTKWYKGKTRTVCGITTPLIDVPRRWEALKTHIDENENRPRRFTSRCTLREAISHYFEWLDYRIATGKPKPLALVTASDYKRNLMSFARASATGGKIYAELQLMEFGPEHFKSFAESLAKRAPSSFARIVATVMGFFKYCRDEGIAVAVPSYRSYFLRPPQAHIRDRRLQQKKSFTHEELWALIEHADVQEKAWIGLALSGAMDNADISHLTFNLFDKSGILLDYRRRKQGLVPRLIPIHPLAREWLDEYLKIRPKPAAPEYEKLVFLTPTGLPLQRSTPGKSGIGNHIDYLAYRWDRLLRRAGLRAKPTFARVCALCGKPRTQPRVTCCGSFAWKKVATMASQNGPTYKGFRSLRTTFANLMPRGFADERKLIMGHTGDITLDHYVEKYGIERLTELVEQVWTQIFTCPWPRTAERETA
jgi:integrase